MTRLALLFLVIIFAFNAYLSLAHGKWYQDHGYLATACHLLGGYFVAMLVYSASQTMFAHLLFARRWQPGLTLVKRLAWGGLPTTAVLAAVALLAGGAWEVFEAGFDRLASLYAHDLWQRSGPFAGPPLDTLSDLVIDVLGAVVFSLRRWRGTSAEADAALTEEEAGGSGRQR